MTASELQNRINRAAKETEQKYQNALEELGELKKKINDLELVIVDDADAKTGEDKEKLDSAMDKLIKLTDFMISESERAWEEYRTLERDCRIGAPEPSNVERSDESPVGPMQEDRRACNRFTLLLASAFQTERCSD